MKYRLGKLQRKHDPRTLKLAQYLPPTLPPIPAAIDWGQKVADWRMMGNDQIGDCTFATAGHLIMSWTGNVGKLVTPADADIVGDYSKLTGYKPGNPTTDQGAVELEVLKFWQSTGIAGHKVAAFVSIDPHNIQHLQAAIYLFGGVYVGVDLPVGAMDDFDIGLPWSNVDDNQIEGGHAIPLIAYNENGFTCVTWGREQHITYDWWAKYADEAYAIISQDWIEANGNAPSGFNLSQLQADLSRVQ
jgi:hypothetical protein